MSDDPIKLDENLSRSHVELLRRLGYVADRVHDQNMSGASDDEVWQRVCDEHRFLITLDLDFSDVRRFPPGSHSGIMLIRPRSRSRDAVLSVLQRICDETSLDDFRGCLVVADEFQTRIRRPPRSVTTDEHDSESSTE